MATALDHMRRIASAVKKGTQIEPDDEAWILACFRNYISGAADGVSLLETFNLSVPAGGEPWFVAVFREERDEALRRAAATVPAVTVAEQVDLLRREIRRYRVRWARADRHRAEMPANYAGTVGEHLFRAFAAQAAMALRTGGIADVPDSPGHLRKTLSAGEIKKSHCAETPRFQRQHGVVSLRGRKGDLS